MKQKIESSSRTAFSYKAGSTIIHNCPAWIKILLLPVLSFVIFKLPAVICAILLCAIFLLQLILKFTLQEIFCDIKLVLYYAVILIIFRGKEVIPMLLRLLCMLLLASLIFRTSSSLQLRRGFETIELAIRKVFHLKPKAPVANALALFTGFIPLVAKNWNQCKRAWKARGGRNSIKMYVVLLPVFFSTGMKQAWSTARAVSIRAA